VRFFVAQIVVMLEDKWFDGSKLIKSEKSYAIHSQLFAAENEDKAYEKVADWLQNEGFSDSNHDGPGDLTEMSAMGIHQIDEIVPLDQFEVAAKDIYGVSLTVFSTATPPTVIKDKTELEIFLLRRFTQGPEGFADY
jgi:hypothetical protein